MACLQVVKGTELCFVKCKYPTFVSNAQLPCRPPLHGPSAHSAGGSFPFACPITEGVRQRQLCSILVKLYWSPFNNEQRSAFFWILTHLTHTAHTIKLYLSGLMEMDSVMQSLGNPPGSNAVLCRQLLLKTFHAIFVQCLTSFPLTGNDLITIFLPLRFCTQEWAGISFKETDWLSS